MEPTIAQLVSVAADALSLVVLVAGAAALCITARERETRRLRSARRTCALISGSLVAATSSAGALDRWALAVSCVAFLCSVQAIALAFGQLPALQSLLNRREQCGEDVWWGEFERAFARYAARDRLRRRLRRERIEESRERYRKVRR